MYIYQRYQDKILQIQYICLTFKNSLLERYKSCLYALLLIHGKSFTLHSSWQFFLSSLHVICNFSSCKNYDLRKIYMVDICQELQPQDRTALPQFEDERNLLFWLSRDGNIWVVVNVNSLIKELAWLLVGSLFQAANQEPS